jgi:hypothetical protein
MKFVAQAAFVTLAVAQIALGVFTEITKPPPGGPKCNPGGKAKCLDVRGAVLANGTPVQMFVDAFPPPHIFLAFLYIHF